MPMVDAWESGKNKSVDSLLRMLELSELNIGSVLE